MPSRHDRSECDHVSGACVWFIVYVRVYQVLLACIGLLIMPGSATQMLFALMVVTTFSVAILKVSPFVFTADSLLAAACGTALWIGTFFGFLSRVEVLAAGSTAFTALGYVLSVLQIALPLLCAAMLTRNFLLYAWQLFAAKHAAGVEAAVLESVPNTRRLYMMLSLQKTQIKALVKATVGTTSLDTSG